jgi:hypothetical protein
MYVEAVASFSKPKDVILELIREPGSLSKYHPFCKRNDAIEWPGNNSIDELEYHNGMTFSRNFFNWSDDGYDLIIGARKKMALVNWIVEGNDNHSSLTIRINPEIRNYVPVKNKYLQYFIWFLYVKPKLQSYINHVVKGFDFYIKNNEQVKHNQFGKHSWFS